MVAHSNVRPLFRMLGPERDFLGEILLPEGDEITIGRSEDNDIVVRDPTVSRHHAKIVKTTEELVWHDASSSNGTWFGEEKIASHTLSHGDRLRIGSTTMVFLSKRRTLSDLFSSGVWRSTAPTDESGGSADLRVSWQVTGVRKDAWAEANRIQVEVDKPIER